MGNPVLARPHLEALLVAWLLVSDDARAAVFSIDRARVSGAAWALLRRLADPAVVFVGPVTKGEHALFERVEALAFGDLMRWDFATLLVLVDQLPERERPTRQKAWERDLERGCSAA